MGKRTQRSWLLVLATISLMATLAPTVVAQPTARGAPPGEALAAGNIIPDDLAAREAASEPRSLAAPPCGVPGSALPFPPRDVGLQFGPGPAEAECDPEAGSTAGPASAGEPPPEYGQYGPRGCTEVPGFNDRCPTMVSWPYRARNGGNAEMLSLLPSPDGATVYAIGWQWGSDDDNGVTRYVETVITAYRASGWDAGSVIWSTTFGGTLDEYRHTGPPWGAALSHDGSRLYVTGEMRHDVNESGFVGEGFVAAFDTATGDMLWSRSVTELAGFPVSELQETAYRVVVSPDNSRIFVSAKVLYKDGLIPGKNDLLPVLGPVNLESWFFALDAATGDLEWKTNYTANKPNYPNFTPDNTLAVSTDGSRLFALVVLIRANSLPKGYATLAFDTSTGAMVWDQVYLYPPEDGEQDVPSSLQLSPDARRVFVVAGRLFNNQKRGNFVIHAYDAADGAPLWSEEYGGTAGTGCDENYQLFQTHYGRVVSISQSGHLVYLAGLATYEHEGSDCLNIGSNGRWGTAVLAVRAATGEVEWERFFGGDGGYSCQSTLCSIDFVPGPAGGDQGSEVVVSTYYQPEWGDGSNYPWTLALDGASGQLRRQARYLDTFNDGRTSFRRFGTSALSPDGTRLYRTIHETSPRRGLTGYTPQIMAYSTGPGPGPEPTPTPTASPTASPSPTPTESPTTSPTPSPTENPTATPTNPPAYPEQPNDPYFGPGEDVLLGAGRYGTQWGPQKIGANLAWQEARATGLGIDVAVLDSGVDLGHPDLACSGKLEVVSDSDVVSNDSNPDDENGHGTHVAGIIAACTDNDTGIAGVAPDATIVPIRVLNASGSGTDAQLIAGINRAVAAGAEVINMSVGYPPGKEIINDVSGIDAAIEAAAAEGVVIVASAGNDSFPLCEYPSLAEDVICVGATDARDNKAWYSTFANKLAGPAVVAPGGSGQPVFCDLDSEDILSLYAVDKDSDTCDGRKGYANLSGTSMAAPHVAGVAALVYDRLGGERSPENAQQVIDAITSTAVDLGPPGYDPIYGSGRIDALEAVLAVEPVDPDPTSTPTDDPSSTPTDDPSSTPTDDPSSTPTDDPSSTPTDDPTTDPGPTTPEAPSNLTARAASSSRIELAWADNSNNETGFAIERSLNGSEWQEIATAGGDSTFHLDMGLDPDTSYFYRVRALNPAGYSGYSNTASATTMRYEGPGSGPSQAPAAPANLNAGSSSPSRIDVSWSDSSNNEDGFALERSADGTSWQEIATTGRNQTSYLDSGLAANTTYQYRVRAYNSAGHSGYSNSASAKTQQAPANGGGGGGGGGGGEPSPSPSQSSSPPVKPTLVGTATTSIAASRSLTTYKEGFELSGVVERDDNCTGPLEVEVSRRIHGTNTYESLSSTAVNGAGAWGLQVVGQRNAAYVAEVKETDTCQGDPSVPTDVLVRAEIAVRVPKRCGGVIRGEVLPANEGEVALQRRAKGRWNEIADTNLDDESRFDLRARRCGVYRLVWSEDGAANEPARQRFRLY